MTIIVKNQRFTGGIATLSSGYTMSDVEDEDGKEIGLMLIANSGRTIAIFSDRNIYSPVQSWDQFSRKGNEAIQGFIRLILQQDPKHFRLAELQELFEKEAIA